AAGAFPDGGDRLALLRHPAPHLVVAALEGGGRGVVDQRGDAGAGHRGQPQRAAVQPGHAVGGAGPVGDQRVHVERRLLGHPCASSAQRRGLISLSTTSSTTSSSPRCRSATEETMPWSSLICS